MICPAAFKAKDPSRGANPTDLPGDSICEEVMGFTTHISQEVLGATCLPPMWENQQRLCDHRTTVIKWSLHPDLCYKKKGL